MFYHVLIGGVLFYAVLISKKSFGTDISAILRNPGWKRITTVGAKHRFFLDGNASFNGKDLFVSSDNPSIDNENSVSTTSAGEHNESIKHYMATHLLACVYVNATVKFVELIMEILEVFRRALDNVKNLARYHRNKPKVAEVDKAKYEENTVDKLLEGREEKGDRSQDRPANEVVDLKMPYTVFVFAVHQLTSSSSMFDLMYSAMKYLTDTIPPDKWFNGFTRYKLINLVLPPLKEFKDKSKNVNLVLKTYAGATDPYYSIKLRELTITLKRFLNDQVKTYLRPFLDQFCTISETAFPSVSKQTDVCKDNYGRQPTPLEVANLFAMEISRLVNEEVSKNYYSELGFLYNIGEQTTSFQRLPNPPSLPDPPSTTSPSSPPSLPGPPGPSSLPGLPGPPSPSGPSSPPNPQTSHNLTELQLFI